MALKPATKRIRITDESVNSYNFWVLTSGIDTTLYEQNPILLWNHNRPKIDNAKQDDILPIGIVQNLQREADGTISGLPAFDDTDEFAMKIYAKYEAGIINMASAGLQPVEVNPNNVKGKSKAICLARSIMAEVSLTDIGSNKNALKLYNGSNEISLSDASDLIKLFFTDNTNKPMLIKLKNMAAILKLADTATEDDVLEAIKKQDETVLQLTNANTKLETDLQLLRDSVQVDKINTLVDGAVNDKKITAADKPQFAKLAKQDYDTTKAVLDAMKPYTSIEVQLSADGDNHTNTIRLNQLIQKSGNDLWESGELDELKKLSMPHFKIKYKEVFEADYKE